jgi:hypothetical protein
MSRAGGGDIAASLKLCESPRFVLATEGTRADPNYPAAYQRAQQRMMLEFAYPRGILSEGSRMSATRSMAGAAGRCLFIFTDTALRVKGDCDSRKLAHRRTPVAQGRNGRRIYINVWEITLAANATSRIIQTNCSGW